MTRLRVQGFTLIELMIVITIIGILVAILVPNFQTSRYQGQLVACESNERNLASALETYNSPNFGGSYPTTLNVLTTGTSTFIQSIPTCPTNGEVYSYTVAADLENYTLSCPNGNHFLVLSNVTQHFPEYSSQNGGMSLGP